MRFAWLQGVARGAAGITEEHPRRQRAARRAAVQGRAVGVADVPFLRHGGGIARTLLLAVSSLGAPSGSRGHSLRASARAFASLHVGVWYLHAHVARDTLRT